MLIESNNKYSGAFFQVVVDSEILNPVVVQKNDTEMTTYVLNNGDRYGIKLCNEGDKIVEAVLKIDGHDMGTFIVEPNVNYESILRPVSIDKRFTFYTVRAVRNAQRMSNPNAGAKSVAMSGIQRTNKLDDHYNGLIQCDFIPECEWTIKVKHEMTGQIFQFLVSASLSIQSFKLLVEEKTHVSYPDQRLKVGDTELLYGKMSAYHTQIEHTVMLSVSTIAISNVVVRTLTGKDFRINIDLSETVSYLKLKIQQVEGIPPDQQKIFFSGQQLQDECKLIECTVQNEDVLHLILRLRGGSSTIQGATTLQGESGQEFNTFDDGLIVDETKKVTIYSRLVGKDEVNPLFRHETATSLRNLSLPSVPPPPSPV